VIREDVALLDAPADAAALGRVPSPVRHAGLGPQPARKPVRLRLRVGALPACSSGRFEPKIDRADARVQVLDAWWEDGFAPRRVDGFVDAMRDALRA